ncbi:hypothetical protein GE061_005228 [Apolygus lucorum]|uniref:CUB domain-containing protein n=1 Tax=Apolygus lucorum TaxID=248454 RepID=A0A8S9WVJ3_APOLU|nr:hypothetical protein GE061_005228 [Apolygus lucorum]
MAEKEVEGIKIKSISKNKKVFRRKKLSDDEQEGSDEEVVRDKIEEMKIIKKLRERPNGVSVVTLALGEKISKSEEMMVTDPFKLKNGGLINMKTLKSGKISKEDDAYDTGIGTQFSAETNKRDEDDEMMKYIEVELSKRKGQKKDEGEEKKYCSPEDAALMAVPHHLVASSSQKNEEMLSNQMLSGIPEVDLGIDAKIKNIEATEDAKLKLLWESRNKKDGPSQFVPTNMAVNFVQHNRFNIEETSRNRQQNPRPAIPLNKPTDDKGTKRKGGVEKATDDYHFEKFKKQYRKYQVDVNYFLSSGPVVLAAPAMALLQLIFRCSILYFVLSQIVTGLERPEEIIYERYIARNPRIIGYYPFIIPPYRIGYVVAAPCFTTTNLEGTCMTRDRCISTGGQPYGTCGTNRRGICCINEKSCGDSTSARVTYFNNPGFNSPYSGETHCELTINQQNSNICQLRVDFLVLELAPPNYEEGATYGTCTTDILNLYDIKLPSICGRNSGQHVYLDFNQGSSIHRIAIDTSGASSLERRWSMKIKQIPCNSTNNERAPEGCLMYYNTTSGSVSSFNYDVGSPTSNDQLNWTRQITNLRYGVCVKPYPDYCSIEWTASDSTSFSLSNTTGNLPCQDTYVLIPQSPISNQNTTDRFCGLTFPTSVTTDMQPYMLWVVTTLDSINSNHTRGFQLNFRQLPCRQGITAG